MQTQKNMEIGHETYSTDGDLTMIVSCTAAATAMTIMAAMATIATTAAMATTTAAIAPAFLSATQGALSQVFLELPGGLHIAAGR